MTPRFKAMTPVVLFLLFGLILNAFSQETKTALPNVPLDTYIEDGGSKAGAIPPTTAVAPNPAAGTSPVAVDRSLEQSYYDPTLPQRPEEIIVAPYEGERYEATVPDTLDLAAYGARAVNFLDRCIAPEEWDWGVYHLIYLNYNPAVLEIGHGSYCMSAKWAEAVVLMRTMSGNNENLQADAKLMASLSRKTGKDGLGYMPVAGNKPWAWMDPVTKERGLPYSEIFGEARQLLAYGRWYQHDHNPLWEKMADQKIDRLLSLTIPKGNGLYFRFTRGYDPTYVETGQGKVVALGDGGNIYEDMTGDGAAFIACWMPEAAGLWGQLTGSKPAVLLADGLANLLYNDPLFYDQKTRTFTTIRHGHSTVFTHAMISMLTHAMREHDVAMIKWWQNGLEQWLATRDSDQTGVILSTEACQIGDSLQAGLMLSRAGIGNYWEEMDRIIRNSMASMQITEEEIARLKQQPTMHFGDPKNTGEFVSIDEPEPMPHNKPLRVGFSQPDDATERTLGAWFVTLENRGASIGCCNGNMCRGLYYAWDSIIESEGNVVKLNLLLNRASRWADVDSYLPHEGKVVIHMKSSPDKLLVRIPEWTDWNQVQCMSNDKPLQYEWDDLNQGYIALTGVHENDKVTVKFPMKEWTVKTRLAKTLPHIEPPLFMEAEVTLRGGTVIGLNETNKEENAAYPMYCREHLQKKEVSMKKVTRFVPKDHYDW